MTLNYTAAPWHKTHSVNGNVMIQAKDKTGNYHTVVEAPNTASVSFGYEEMQANASLMALSPEVFTALVNLVAVLDDDQDCFVALSDSISEAMAKAESVIKHVKGL